MAKLLIIVSKKKKMGKLSHFSHLDGYKNKDKNNWNITTKNENCFLKRENINNAQWKTQEKNKYVNNYIKGKIKMCL